MAKTKAPKKAKKVKPPKSRGWKLLANFADRGSKTAARKALGTGWKSVTGKEPPTEPENPTTSATEAAVWALLSTGLVEISRIFAARGAARYYERSTGQLPPNMREPEPEPEPEIRTKKSKKKK